MRHSLYLKFVFVYILLGFAGFFITSTLGSHLIERQLIIHESTAIYNEATSIASNSMIRYRTSTSNLDAIYASLDAICAYQETEIWILNMENEIVVNTGDPTSSDTVQITNFDPTAWGSTYYQIGDFYETFHQEMMSVIAPITANMTVKGYVVIHKPMTTIYENREELLSGIYIVVLIFFLISLLIPLFFSHHIYRPLRKIIVGADEFATGHLEYQIPVNTQDEMGYLATSLNFMANELGHTKETQREFIANVSHDFRSPLTSIKGYLVAISDNTIPYEMQGKYIDIVIHETERLEKLTQSLLTLNKLDGKTRLMNLGSFDINKIIKSTVATFEGICRNRKISIELILTGEELFVCADMEQIQQVLYNLLDNAIKFSPADSTITLETTEKNDRVFVSVKDRGCGIARENLPKIWDRFYKIDSSRGKDRKGTGLGLAIVKEIINSHNQNINVISTKGVGTEFIFTLDAGK